MSVSLTRRSEGLAAQEFNGQSDYVDLSSSDGVYIVFSTDATNAFLADSNGVTDIWRQNGQSGALERVSCSIAGAPTDGASFSPAISADGRYVAFTSLGSNLTLNDGNGFADVFRKDMATGAVLIVSAAPDGLSANSVSFGPAISADGRYVVFLSAASNIVTDDTNYSVDVFRKDMVTSKTLRVNLAAADGRYVAFDSAAANLTGSDSNNRDDVFVKDMLSGAVSRASEGPNGESLTGGLEGILKPAISTDGRYVVFATSTAMVAGDSNGVADIYRKDLLSGAILRVSTDSAGNQGNAASFDADISADGRYVAFDSAAANLTGSDSNNRDDVFVKDMLS
ncbi:MAG: calcium-binding protein, partial [Rhodospirillales bacterium]|nr:calcium-binding protein [Rhodospirillales bacterium]